MYIFVLLTFCFDESTLKVEYVVKNPRTQVRSDLFVRMHIGYAYPICTSDMYTWYADRKCLSDMQISYTYPICMSEIKSDLRIHMHAPLNPSRPMVRLWLASSGRRGPRPPHAQRGQARPGWPWARPEPV